MAPTSPNLAPPVVLTIAGSDSGGGAGIQADLKTFHQWGVFGTSALTAVTVQNTLGVRHVHPVPEEVVRAQIGAVAEDFPLAAAKTGMLHSADLVHAVADAVLTWSIPHLVVDPVMVATSGDVLLEPGAVQAVLERLVPLATVVTPNLPEAALLVGRPVATPEEQAAAARALVEAGAKAALVKGGHGAGDLVEDVLWDGSREWRFQHPRIATRHTHGTGCTLSAAIAAGLAHGQASGDAVERALDFVHRAIVGAPGLGQGNGPLGHWAPTEE
ncbi:MAG: bifunctional hydroxymethylpyrimidine kinase/phosphomethylpyrimidine kinase [Gemmatimonadetes bacterium]|nr:bifunctional hydroxymethylpyrimidine kinase/phosphomethylpyrimidine kinase [Gemmatimonadota bacterium]